MSNMRLACLLALLLSACSAEKNDKCVQGALIVPQPEHWNEWDAEKRQEWQEELQRQSSEELIKCLKRKGLSAAPYEAEAARREAQSRARKAALAGPPRPGVTQ